MKVNEFAKLLGIPQSKVRYYDREGLIHGQRIESNNYRDFTKEDALNIYNAQMLRSFDMSVQESLTAQNNELSTINGWLDDHVIQLEKNVRWEEMKLIRLKEMQSYYSVIQKGSGYIAERILGKHYWVTNLSNHTQKPLSDPLCDAVQRLVGVMPFSYIMIKITKESILRETGDLDISIGLGILKTNKDRLNLELPPEVESRDDGRILEMFLEMEDPFQITREMLTPLMEAVKMANAPVRDISGRVYLSYMKDNRYIHGIGLGTSIEE